jgi:murein L,D-transpeptidase YafK
MRNLACLMCVLLLMVAGAGCGGGAATTVAKVTLDKPLPEYHPPRTKLTAEQQYIKKLLVKRGYNYKYDKPTILVIHKVNRTLTCYVGLTPIKTYPVVLGHDPYNNKLCQGDDCTPEGVYRVRAKYPHPRWDYFIWLNYPNTKNWIRFARAKEAGKIPPDAQIGGQIGIHGTDDAYRNLIGANWTEGCISLLNKDLDQIYPLVNDKTLIIIKKQ